MNSSRPVLGAASGLLLAALLIVAVSIAGGGSLHLDLAKASTAFGSSNGLSTQGGEAGGTSAVAPQTSSQTTQVRSSGSGGSPVSSLDGLTSQGGGSLILLLLPIVLGAILGTLFYGTYARRVEAE